MISRKPGFTLLELLVAIALLLALAALVIVGTRKAFQAAYKADAVSDLRGLANITLAAAKNNNGTLPDLHNDTTFPHHLRKRNGTEEELENGMLTVEDLYDNGLTEEGATCNGFPGVTKRSVLDERLYDRDYAEFTYIYLANDNGWATGAGGGSVEFPEERQGHLKAFSDEELREMSPLPSRTDDAEVWYPYLWAGLCLRENGEFKANFLEDKDEADGVHVAYLDGRVEWRRWEDVSERYKTQALTIFW